MVLSYTMLYYTKFCQGAKLWSSNIFSGISVGRASATSTTGECSDLKAAVVVNNQLLHHIQQILKNVKKIQDMSRISGWKTGAKTFVLDLFAQLVMV